MKRKDFLCNLIGAAATPLVPGIIKDIVPTKEWGWDSGPAEKYITSIDPYNHGSSNNGSFTVYRCSDGSTLTMKNNKLLDECRSNIGSH